MIADGIFLAIIFIMVICLYSSKQVSFNVKEQETLKRILLRISTDRGESVKNRILRIKYNKKLTDLEEKDWDEFVVKLKAILDENPKDQG